MTKELQTYKFDRKETFQTAMKFLDAMQNPQNCSGLEYIVVDMGCGGGFAAHFQLAGSEWMRTAKAINFSKPILIMGHIRGYSDGPECDHVDKDWTCFFQPMSNPTCQKELLSSGRRVGVNLNSVKLDDSIIPLEFAHVGFAYWWGIVQSRMFRMQPEIEKMVIAEGSKMDHGRGFPLKRGAYAIAGMHVRHGDKSSDGFKHHSFEEEAAAVKKAPECDNSGKLGNCIKTYNDTVSQNSSNLSFSPNTRTGAIRLFVASDDASVLISARLNGHLVKENVGVSQQTSSAGMFKTLLSNKAVAYNATVEIVTDIFYLAHCSTLIGIAASQVFRLAVGLSNATGVLEYASVMDYQQLGKIRHMSAKWALPLPEEFVPA